MLRNLQITYEDTANMKYIKYKESRKHGSFDFPFAFYSVAQNHPRYHMLHHWHPEFELIRVVSGRLGLQIDGLEFIGNVGDCFLLTGGMVHRFVPYDCHYECIVFDMNYFSKEYTSVREKLLDIADHNKFFNYSYPATMTEETSIFADIFHAISEKKTGFEFVILGSFYRFFGLAFQKNLFYKDEKLPEHLRKMKQFKSAISMIQQHYSEDITLKDIAASVHMNPNYFCRFFKEFVDQTPVQYLNYYRISSACEKLASSSGSITEIAMECGFNDVSYFVKVFKKFKGVTPTQYFKKLPF